MSKILILKPGSASWNAVWTSLANDHGGDTLCECKASGEVWQYMGTVVEGKAAHHEFRHRSLNGERTYKRYPATIVAEHYENA